jgi:hypothetical protein
MAVDCTNKVVRVTVSKAVTEDAASFRGAVIRAVLEKLNDENERLGSFANFTSVLGSDCAEGATVMLSPAGTLRGSTKASTSASSERRAAEVRGHSRGGEGGRPPGRRRKQVPVKKRQSECCTLGVTGRRCQEGLNNWRRARRYVHAIRPARVPPCDALPCSFARTPTCPITIGSCFLPSLLFDALCVLLRSVAQWDRPQARARRTS